MRKLMGSDQGSLIDKAKAVHTSKAEQGIHSPLPLALIWRNRVKWGRLTPTVIVYVCSEMWVWWLVMGAVSDHIGTQL